jgi:hypothetical protein
MPSITRSVIVEMVCLDTCASYTSARCAAISPWVKPLADNEITSPSISGEAALALAHDLRLKRPVPVPRYRDLHRPDVGQQLLGAGAVAGVAAVAASRIVLGGAEMIVHLALGRVLSFFLRSYTV